MGIFITQWQASVLPHCIFPKKMITLISRWQTSVLLHYISPKRTALYLHTVKRYQSCYVPVPPERKGKAVVVPDLAVQPMSNVTCPTSLHFPRRGRRFCYARPSYPTVSSPRRGKIVVLLVTCVQPIFKRQLSAFRLPERVRSGSRLLKY